MADYDSPWKEMLDEYLPSLVEFFFLDLFQAIDWSRGFESLDTELQQVVRDAELGPRRIDRLFKVWRTTGEEEWLLIHLEVQSQEDSDFPLRMYVYHYRIFDKYGRTVVSLAILGDDRPAWRPSKFEYNNWGCKLALEFPTAKLMDYAGREEELESSLNVFAAVVLAHLKSQQTRGDVQSRRVWKLRIVRGLYERGWDRDKTRNVFAFIDWVMDLPREVDRQLHIEVIEFERENQMPYVTSVERFGIEKGIQIGIEQGRQEGRLEGLHEALKFPLELKFGNEGVTFSLELRSVNDADRLNEILSNIKTADSVAELRTLAGAK